MGKSARKGSGTAYHTLLWFLYAGWSSSVSVTDIVILCPWSERHTSALVSPWMDNGDALAYVKKHQFVDYKRLVRCSFELLCQHLDCVIVDPRHRGRDQSFTLNVSSDYPWKLKSSACRFS